METFRCGGGIPEPRCCWDRSTLDSPMPLAHKIKLVTFHPSRKTSNSKALGSAALGGSPWTTVHQVVPGMGAGEVYDPTP